MLVQRLERRINIRRGLGQRIVFVGMLFSSGVAEMSKIAHYGVYNKYHRHMLLYYLKIELSNLLSCHESLYILYSYTRNQCLIYKLEMH